MNNQDLPNELKLERTVMIEDMLISPVDGRVDFIMRDVDTGELLLSAIRIQPPSELWRQAQQKLIRKDKDKDETHGSNQHDS